MKVKTNNQLPEENTTNHGVRQGCPLSLTLFNIHIYKIILKWNQIYTKGVTLSTIKKQTLFCLQMIKSQ
jgi:hypothetical protein